MIRKAIYAGTWYPALRSEIEKYLEKKNKTEQVKAVISPHAGWMYSGKIAGQVFSTIKPVENYIVIGPNHRGMGNTVSIFSEGSWETPLGPLKINSDIAKSLVTKSGKLIKPDPLAHANEHSLEVQMPFIKYFSPSAKIVPIALFDYTPETCRQIGESISETLKELNLQDNTVLVASNDMSHFVSSSHAKKADNMAIEKINNLDPDGLLETVKENDISMCGSGPIACVLWAAKLLGATKTELIKYGTSGDVTGDNNEVVAYAGMIIY